MTTLIKMKCLVDYCVEVERTKGYCGRHYTSLWRNGSPVHVDAVVEITTGLDGYKVCSKCFKVKTTDSFYSRVRDGIERVDKSCKDCIQSQASDYRRNRQPEHVAQKRKKTSSIYWAKRKYGDEGVLVRERMDAGEPCDICGGKTAKMAIDHDHGTGEVRGLLCGNCNTGLGLFGDDVDTLEKAIEYLKASAAAKRAARRG